MKNLSFYLDKAEKVTGSDYMTAKRLEISRQYISNARHGKTFSPEVCVKLAELVKEEPLRVIAASECQKKAADKDFWAKHLASVCLSISALLYYNQALIDGLARELYRLCKKGNWSQRERLAL